MKNLSLVFAILLAMAVGQPTFAQNPATPQEVDLFADKAPTKAAPAAPNVDLFQQDKHVPPATGGTAAPEQGNDESDDASADVPVRHDVDHEADSAQRQEWQQERTRLQSDIDSKNAAIRRLESDSGSDRNRLAALIAERNALQNAQRHATSGNRYSASRRGYSHYSGNSGSYSRLSTLNNQIASLRAKLQAKDQQVRVLRNQLASANSRIAVLEQQLKESKAQTHEALTQYGLMAIRANNLAAQVKKQNASGKVPTAEGNEPTDMTLHIPALLPWLFLATAAIIAAIILCTRGLRTANGANNATTAPRRGGSAEPFAEARLGAGMMSPGTGARIGQRSFVLERSQTGLYVSEQNWVGQGVQGEAGTVIVNTVDAQPQHQALPAPADRNYTAADYAAAAPAHRPGELHLGPAAPPAAPAPAAPAARTSRRRTAATT